MLCCQPELGAGSVPAVGTDVTGGHRHLCSLLAAAPKSLPVHPASNRAGLGAGSEPRPTAQAAAWFEVASSATALLLQELRGVLRAHKIKGFKGTQPGVLRSSLSRGKRALQAPCPHLSSHSDG